MFIKNFSRNTVLLISILQITGDHNQIILAITSKKNQSVANKVDCSRIGTSIKNLSIVVKSKKSNLTKAEFAKVNSSKTDFLTFKAKKVFIYLQKAFTKALILRYLDPKCHFWIKINTIGYAICGILGQITLNYLN